MSAQGQTRKIRACPLHVCFTPLSGRMPGRVLRSALGHYRSFAHLPETEAIASQGFARLGALIVQQSGQPASPFPKSRFRAESLP